MSATTDTEFEAPSGASCASSWAGQASPEPTDMVSVDPKSLRLEQLARRVAATEATVMITGESGVGKEVVARYIHDQSERATAPFVAINCAAIPEQMLESLLFGHEKGAYTGAYQAHAGKFEQAQGGTLLLDEVTEMDLGLQAKLLRVLQEREVERLGGRQTISLDVRVLATSNRNLLEAVSAGQFREDLYYRLNVFPLQVLPLRERPADILPLAQGLLARYHGPYGSIRLDEEAQIKLLEHTWPGNVRELDNVIQRALILRADAVIRADDICYEPSAARRATAIDDLPTPITLGGNLRARELDLILDAIKQQGSKKEAAARLGISPRTLRYKLAKLRAEGFVVPA